MLVSPQHFQQQDLYHEALLDERIAALTPYRWGVAAVDIDPGALGSDQLRITRFVGILPDGLFAAFEGGDPECPKARPIGAHFPPAQAACDVYLCLPKERAGIPSVYAPQEAAVTDGSTVAARARFRASTRKVSDLTGNGQDLTIAFAHRNTVVLFGDEARDDFDSIKIAEIVRDSTGALLVNEAYIPPALRIDASAFLMAGVRRMLALMVAKQRQLAGDRRQRDGASIEFNSADVTRFLQLSTVNTAIPVLTYAASNGEISPTQLYLLLIQVAGQLCTFSPDVDPSKLPIFSHTGLRATFEELFARVTALLRTTVREAYMSVPMEIVDGFHIGTVDDEKLQRAPVYVLAISSDVPEDRLAQRLPGMCKIASRTQLPSIIRSAASPGVPITVTHRPPQEIPIKAGVTYFTLNIQNDFWRQILQERTVALYLPPPFGPEHVKLELLAIPRTT
jgi:type VI secretion system protein ImpJ